MKNITRILALVVTILPLFAVAQLRQSEKIVTNVPFEFALGNKTVPAGVWEVQPLGDGSSTLAIRNRDAHLSSILNTSTGETRIPAASCALVFHRYGDRHFLAGVKVEGSNVGYRVPESKREAEMRAQNIVPKEEILLASLK